MLINEQFRRYNEKMEEIEQLEYAETVAMNQLKLKRQNTVRNSALLWSGSLSVQQRSVSMISPESGGEISFIYSVPRQF